MHIKTTGLLSQLDDPEWVRAKKQEPKETRTIIDIEKAALVTAEEGRDAPRFRRCRRVDPTRLKTVGDDGRAG